MNRLRRWFAKHRPQSPPDNTPGIEAPPILMWMVLFGAFSGVLLLLILLPVDPLTGLLLLAMVGGLVVTARRGNLNILSLLRPLLFHDAGAAEAGITPLSRRRALVEIALVVAVAMAATSHYLVDDPTQTLDGGEVEIQVFSINLASISLREHGYIPMWNPYFEFGHPFIDRPPSVLLNPFSSAPGLLFGGQRGVKLGVTLQVIIAGTGGWFLARVLGLGALARVLLALLLTGKGNMVAMMGEGYYQLASSQAYFAWVIGGLLAILRTRQRWPIVLTALASALMLWGGNIWYTLPILLCMGALVLAEMIRMNRVDSTERSQNKPLLKRLILAGLLTITLSAITLWPIWANRAHIGGHPDERPTSVAQPLGVIASAYFNDDAAALSQLWTDTRPEYSLSPPAVLQLYYSYVTPFWFALLIFVLIPPIAPRLHRSGIYQGWRVWPVGLALVVVMTLWGAGGNPVMIWLYEHIPMLGQWRFVGRVLAVGSFWIAVLVAMRVDGLWRALMAAGYTRLLKYVAMASLTLAASIAVLQTNSKWGELAPTASTGKYTWVGDRACINWLRRYQPEGELTVFMHRYMSITTFFENGVRLYNIEADYQPLPLPSTIGQISLTEFVSWLEPASLPEYAYLRVGEDNWIEYFRERGYREISNSPKLKGMPCLWHNPDVLSYAYTIPLNALWDVWELPLDIELTYPITAFRRLPDRVALVVEEHPTEQLVVTVQELAYPGWRVEVDGEPAQLESVGGQIGVVLEPGTGTRRVYFEYAPPLVYVGGAATLLTAIFCAGYLLRVERVFKNNGS